MSNTKKCSLCEKEYTAILPNCPNCLCPANNKVVSNTDKLQEIKQRWNKAIGLVSSSNIEWLISQLEESREEIRRLKEGAVISEEYACYDERTKIADLTIQLEQAQAYNEKLKDDNQKLVEVVESYRNVNIFSSTGSEMFTKKIEINQRAIQVLSEVKG